MRKVFTGGACAAAVLAFSLAAFAQSGQTGQTGAQAPQPTMKSDQPQVTLVGCVQRESDYRASKGAGSGGAAGTGVGAGNEFVLVNATVSPTGATGTGSATGAQTGTTGTSGSTAMGEAYELTGSGEGELETYIGRRVEITGHLKAGSDAARTSGATGTGTGTGTGGTNILGQDLNLKEFEVMSVKAAEGTCPTLTPKK